MADPSDLLAIARRLAREARLSEPVDLERLAGGRNNQVFKVTLRSDEPVVLKSYYRDTRDPRDRLGAEWAFINYARSLGICAVPRPLAAERESNCGLYSFIGGRKLTAGEVDGPKIDAALDFVEKLNAAPRPAPLANGSEACFAIGRHLAMIDRRVARLDRIDPEAPYHREAETFVARRLRPVWAVVREAIIADCGRLGLSLDEELAADETCASPSDFGFHNALVDPSGGITFLDFEYAGRDDPAKLIADFFCQPELPVPFAYYDRFADRVMTVLGLGPLHRERAQLLTGAYRVKWLCITLNDFVPADAARRAFSTADARVARCAERLAQASSAIDLVTVT